MIYPDQNSASYTYNRLNQLDRMPEWISGSPNFDSAGRFTGYTLANHVSKVLDYDQADRLVGLTYRSLATTLKTYSLRYDDAGNIIDKNENHYVYDAINQLISANQKGWFVRQPERVAQTAHYGTGDRDYAGTKVIDFNVAGSDLVKLDTAARSVAIDLGDVMGINQVQIKPDQPVHRLRMKDLTIYTSQKNSNDWVKEKDWAYSQDRDGSILIRFPKIILARYIKVKTSWDDRDIDNNTVDRATVGGLVNGLIRVWALRNSQLQQFDYDQLGNRKFLSIDGEQADYSYYKNSTGGNSSWLASDKVWFYQYDENGNLLTKAKKATVNTSSRSFVLDPSQEYWTYGWDVYNRLTLVGRNGITVATYQYDSDNLRVARTADSETTVYAYGRNGAIAYEKNLATGKARTYMYLGTQTVGWIDTAPNGVQARYYAITDNQGSITSVTDQDAKVVWSSEYTAFGKTAGVEGLYDYDGSYAGHQPDPTTGLIYMWNRWQDPETGRFISEDPARDGDNWYAYVGNNPINSLDPTGLIIVKDLSSHVRMSGFTDFIGNTSLNKKGCVIAAWTKIINTINGNTALSPKSFGSTTAPGGSLTSAIVVAGENSKYVKANGDLSTQSALNNLTKGGYTVLKANAPDLESGNILKAGDLSDVLEALQSIDAGVYVTGQANLGGDLGNHTENITDYTGNGKVAVDYTSNADEANKRQYSTDSDLGYRLNQLTFAIPTKDLSQYSSALKAVQDQHWQDSQAAVKDAASVSDEDFWNE